MIHAKTPSSATGVLTVAAIQARIRSAAMAAGRAPESVELIAVSKTRSTDEIRAVRTAGVRSFGENYAREALPKIAGLSSLDITWHFIGHLQANKTREVAQSFDWVHTLDRERIVDRLAAQTPPDKTLNVLLQVNVDGDPAKGGIDAGDEPGLRRLMERVRGHDRLRLRGLMTILAESTPPGQGYGVLKGIFENLRSTGGSGWDTLSMGMSADFEAAIACGATMVRVGQALFGPRQPKSDAAEAQT